MINSQTFPLAVLTCVSKSTPSESRSYSYIYYTPHRFLGHSCHASILCGLPCRRTCHPATPVHSWRCARMAVERPWVNQWSRLLTLGRRRVSGVSRNQRNGDSSTINPNIEGQPQPNHELTHLWLAFLINHNEPMVDRYLSLWQKRWGSCILPQEPQKLITFKNWGFFDEIGRFGPENQPVTGISGNSWKINCWRLLLYSSPPLCSEQSLSDAKLV